jgi:hypothetical protein
MQQPSQDQNKVVPAKQTQADEGLFLRDLASGTVVEIETRHHHYKLVMDADAHVHLSGHPKYCPEPVEVEVEGSFRSRRRVNPQPGFIGRGMHMVFKHPLFRDRITTSRIREIHKLD